MPLGVTLLPLMPDYEFMTTSAIIKLMINSCTPYALMPSCLKAKSYCLTNYTA